MKRSLLATALLVAVSVAWADDSPPATVPLHEHAWSYEGTTDPSHWGELDPDFFQCAAGKLQSPIDIHGARHAQLPAIGFDYPTGPAKVRNTGHTIEIEPADGGTLTTPTGTYHLAQFHFHTPSETRFNGRAYPLAAHFVHRDDQGHVAVVAVMFKLGKRNPQLSTLFRTLPEPDDQAVPMPGHVTIAGLLPKKLDYYTFSGSLTTPPCTEDVQWYVLKRPLTISAEQLAAFRSRYPMNARPVQPLDGRDVSSS